MKQSNLILIILMSMIIHDFHENKIIINLIFVFSIIHDWLIHCQIIIKLNKIFNHKLIETLFYSDIRMRKTIKHKSWKKIQLLFKLQQNSFNVNKIMQESAESQKTHNSCIQQSVYMLCCEYKIKNKEWFQLRLNYYFCH